MLLVFCLVLSDQALAAIAYVKQNGSVSSNSAFPTTTVPVSITSAPTVGNTLIVQLATDYSSGGTPACSDNAGNAYNIDFQKVNTNSAPNFPFVMICSARVAAVPTTITVTHHPAYNRIAFVHEFSGLAAAPSVDRISVSLNAAASTTPSSGATAATTQASELLVGAVSAADGNTTIFNNDASFTGGPFRLSQGSGSYPRALQTQYRIVSATGSYTYAPTLTASRLWAAGIATYKEAAAAATTTLGNGTSPANASLAPGDAATNAGAFSFQTSSGTDIITAATVTLAAGTSGGLGLVEITNSAGTIVYGSVTNPASDTPAITLSTNTLTATTTLTEYRIRTTPKTHANMPAPAGSSYAVTARISAWTGTNAQAGSDAAGTTVTIDNLSPGNVTASTATAGNAQVALSWSNPADADLNSIIVLRRATSAVADVPVEGATYTVGNTIGTATVACVVASPGTSCSDTGLTNGTAYHYKIFVRDSNGNYSATGVVPTGSPVTPNTCPGNVVTTTADTGTNSLRECINTANLNPGTTISFNIPGPGNQSAGVDSWWRITPATALPGISGANTVIDGTTQTTNRGNTNSLGPEIEINGATVGGVGLDGFGVSSPANNVTIKGFIINQWSGAGISLWTGTGTVTGNYIGTNYAGTAALANTAYGIYVNSNGNTIGGTTAAARNVIAGNGGPGIRIVGNSNTVQGNYIGVNATAGGALPNATDGIQMTATATGNTIGGTVAGAGNVISGNTGGGISNISSGSNSVQGNYIGTNASSASLPNGGDGLYTSAGTVNLGNASEVQSNVIGPNTGIGINLAGGIINLAGTVTVNDDVTLSTGTLVMGSATLNVSGNWTRTSATVTPGTSTVNLNGTTNQTITTGGASFFNLTLNNTGAAGSDKAIISGTLTTGGALTVTDGTLDIGTNTPAVNTAGNVTISTAGSINVTGRTVTWTFNGTSIFTDSSSTGPQQLGSITVGGSSSTLNLASSMKVWSMSINAGNTANLGSGGYTLEITVGGTPLWNAGTFTAGISTVRYTGYLAGVTVAPNATFNSLELAPGGAATYSLGNATTVTGNLTIGANTSFTTTASNYALNVAGNWSNSGTFVANGGTVTLNGANQTITGNTTFNNFTKSVSSAATLTFAAGSTTTINGLATVNGASGQLLSLRSSVNGTRWNIRFAGTKAISFVDVRDSDASGSAVANKPVSPASSSDGGNNISWFGSAISGTVYIDEGVTNIGAGKTVRLIKNGVDAGSTTTDASGVYSITPAALVAGDALLVYIDGDATYKGTTVTVSNGATLSGLNIYASYVITRHDNAGSLSNANMGTAKGAYVDTDILYSVSSGNLVVTSGNWLYTPTGHSFTPGGNVTTTSMANLGTFNGGSGSITVQGQLIQRAGTYTATSGTTSISASFTVSGGTFIHNSGTVLMTSTGWRTYNIGSTILNNFTIGIPSAAVTIVGTIDVNGNLTITGGDIISGTIAVAGNVTTTNAGVVGGAVILFDGTGAQTLGAGGGSGALPGVNINKASGTLTIQDTVNIGGTTGWTYTAGTVDAGSSTVGFTNTTATTTVSAGATAFNNVNIAVSGMTLNVTGALDVNGNLNLTSAGTINGGAITVAGNLTSADTAVDGTTTITLDGTAAQSINTSATGDLPDGTFTINKASGTATLASALALNGAGQNLTVAAGTLDLAGVNLTVPATLAVSSGTTLQLQGGQTVTAATRTFNAGSTVIYNGGGAYASLAAGNSYSNLAFNNATGSWTHTTALTASNLTITAGTLNSSGQNVNVSGNWSNSGTYTPGANTVTFNGTAQSITGNTIFNNFTKSVATADTLTFAAGSTQTFGGTINLQGASGQLLSLRSSTPGTRWNFVVNASATKAISYVNVADSDASGSAASQKPIGPSNSTDMGNNIAWFAIPTVVKSMTVISDPLNNTTNPKAIPGAIVEYTITIANGTGASTATNIVLTDSLNANITAGRLAFNPNTYAAGQGVQVTAPNINGGAAQNLTNVADADAGDFNVTGANTVTVSGITLAAGQSATVKFRVTVQ